MTTITTSIELTTIFTPPASCAGVLTYDGSYFWQGEIFETGDVNCYPASFSLIHESFYSPGICPLGWNGVSTVAGTGALVFNTAESNALCCPSGYSAVVPSLGPNPTGNTLFCGSSLSGLLTNVFSTSTLASGPLPDNPSLTSINVDQVSASVTPTAWAEMLQVRWQSTDTEIISLMAAKATMTTAPATTASTSSSSSSSSTSTSGSSSLSSSSSTTSSATAATSSSAGGSGLSTGAKIGLGVGIPVGVLAMIIGAFLLMRKHKQRKEPATQNTVPANFGSGYPQGKPELDGRYNMAQAPMYQQDSNMKHGYYRSGGQIHQNYENAELPG